MCRADDGKIEVLYTTGQEIKAHRLRKRKDEAFEVIKNEARIEAIDYDPKKMIIFWIDSKVMPDSLET